MSANYTMLDWAAETGNLQTQGIVETILAESQVLARANVRYAPGMGEPYSREGNLPTAYTRRLTEVKTPTTGRDENLFEHLGILTVPGQMDRAQFEMNGGGATPVVRAKAQARAAKAIAHKFDYLFINGNQKSDSSQFDGLKTRITGSQVINCTVDSTGATSSGGDILTTYQMNRAWRYLRPQDRTRAMIYMNPDTQLLLSKAMEGTPSATQPVELAGQVFETYRGIPIGILEQDAEGNDILPFTEPAANGGATATCSLYFVVWGEDETSIIQSLNGPRIYDRDEGTAKKDDLEWIVSFVNKRPEAIVRLKNIKLAIAA